MHRGAGDLFYPGSKQQGGARVLFYPTVPQKTRGCWGPILPWVLTNSKGVLGTYATLGPHKQQGGARDLCYPGSSQTARGCWGPMLPWVLTNSKGVLGIYATLRPHKQQGGAGDLFSPYGYYVASGKPYGTLTTGNIKVCTIFKKNFTHTFLSSFYASYFPILHK